MDSKVVAQKAGSVLRTIGAWILVLLCLFFALAAFHNGQYREFPIFLLGGILLMPSVGQFLVKVPVLKNAVARSVFAGICFFVGMMLLNEDPPKRSSQIAASVDNNDTASRGVSPKEKTLSKEGADFGKYYALVIGESEYESQSLPQLKKPVEDAIAFSKVITEN